eukprot:EG_transcript_10309
MAESEAVEEGEYGSDDEEVASSNATKSPKSISSRLLGKSQSGRSGWSAAQPPSSGPASPQDSARPTSHTEEFTVPVPPVPEKLSSPTRPKAPKPGDKAIPSPVHSPGAVPRPSRPASGNADAVPPWGPRRPQREEWQARHDDVPQPHRRTRALHEPVIHSDSPGPTYLPDIAYCKPRGPEPFIGSGPRFRPKEGIHPTATVPMYRVEQPWTSKPVTMAKGPRFRPTPGEDVPAPTDYMPDYSAVKRTAPVVKIFQQPREVVAPIRPETPSRGEPNAGPLPEEAKPRKKKGRKVIGGPLDPSAPCTFGIAYAAKPLVSTGAPGPGSYHKPSMVGHRGYGATLFKTGRAMETHRKDYEAEPGLYNPSIESVRPRAPAPMCYLTSS